MPLTDPIDVLKVFEKLILGMQSDLPTRLTKEECSVIAQALSQKSDIRPGPGPVPGGPPSCYAFNRLGQVSVAMGERS